MKKEFKEFKKIRKDFSDKLRVWLRDASVPLDKRFELLCFSGFGNTSDRTDFNLGDDDFLHEELVMQKYETRGVDHIFEALLEYDLVNEEQQITFKEYCVENFISNMCFDW